MRILMLGNSLTSANDMPSTLARLAAADVVAHTRGGARLAEHLNPATRMGAATQAALANERWDFVVLQESSNGPVVHKESFLRAACNLCELVRAAGAAPVLFATWAYAPESEKLARMGMSYEGMARALRDAYHEAAVRGGAVLADVGERFLERTLAAPACAAAPAGEPRASLYARDGVHPSEGGSLLAAETIAAAIQA